MTMVVNDRHLSCMLVVQLLCSLSLQQEIFVHKWFHIISI